MCILYRLWTFGVVFDDKHRHNAVDICWLKKLTAEKQSRCLIFLPFFKKIQPQHKNNKTNVLI